MNRRKLLYNDAKIIVLFSGADRPVLHEWGSLSDRRRRELLEGSEGHAPPGNFEIYPLRNAISSVLRANLSCF